MPLLVSIAFSFLLWLAILLSPPDIAKEIVQEHGIVESLSAFLWTLSVLVIVASRIGKGGYSLASLPLFCAMRELDMHKTFTTDSVLKLRYWTGDAAPVLEKTIAAIVLAVFLYAMISAIIKYQRAFFAEMRQYSPIAVAVVSALGYIFVSKIFFDGFTRKFGDFVDVAPPATFWILVAEEVMELTAASLVAYASFYQFGKSRI